MKYNEIKDPEIRRARYDYIHSLWRSWQEVFTTAFDRIINYIFVLNTGGLIAALTYIASKSATVGIIFSIWCFVFGIILITIHAALSYYIYFSRFGRLKKDSNAFLSNEMDWEEFIKRENSPIKSQWIFHVLGWASAIVFTFGLGVGIWSLTKIEPGNHAVSAPVAIIEPASEIPAKSVFPEIINAFGSAAAGALLGSLSAFYLGVLQQRRDKKDKEHSALLRAQYALLSQWNDLEWIRKKLLEPHRQNENRSLTMPLYYSVGCNFMISFADISFIANSDDPNLWQEVHVAQLGYESAVENMRLRNKKLDELYNSPDVKTKEFDPETGKSKIEASNKDIFLLKQVTNSLYESVDTAIPKLIKETEALEAYIKRNYKGMKALSMTPK